jgi:hypothetical protein
VTIDVAQTVEQATADSAPPSFLETIMGLAPKILPFAPFGGLVAILPAVAANYMDGRDHSQRKDQLTEGLTAATEAQRAAAEAGQAVQGAAEAQAAAGTTKDGKPEPSGYLGVDDMRDANAVATVVGNDGVTRYYVNTKDGAREVLYKDSDAYTTLMNMGNKERLEWRKAMWLGGFYDPQSFVGPITADDIAVMQAAMTEANMTGVTWQDATASRVEQGARYGRPITESEIMALDDEVPGLIKQYASKNGIVVSDDFIARQQRRVLNGKDTPESVLERIRDQYVKTMYPQFSDELDQGMTIEDIASPYVDMAASLLEMPAGSIGMDDPIVKQALQARDDAGNPIRQPIWKFQEQVTSDPRWKYTNNAYQSYGSAINSMLSEMGL